MDSFENKYGSCGMYYTMSIVEGKWKWIILWEIHKEKVIRYNRLKDKLQPIAHKKLVKYIHFITSTKHLWQL